MDQPGRLYKLFASIHRNRQTDGAIDTTSITGSDAVDSVIRLLSAIDLVRLLKFIRDWNVRAKTSEVAQVVLNAVVTFRSAEEIRQAFDKVQRGHLAIKEAEEATKDEDEEMEAAQPPKRPLNTSTSIGLKDLLEGLIPYTDRHAARLDKLMVESYMLDYIVGEMDGGIVGGEVIEF
jgi:U3 small nucleolar RNA-associated protein 13